MAIKLTTGFLSKIKGKFVKYKVLCLVLFTCFCTAYYFCLPRPLFRVPFSTSMESKDGELLGALIAADGQWRFPPGDSIPEKYKIALVHFEDKHFYKHIGFNPFSIIRAAYDNINSGKVVSGGSTITMQVIRLSRKGKPRTVFEKLIEIILATRLELSHSKDQILRLHASHAPFGGNVVGIRAATWRYFQREAYDLSWAEAALLAVLPNSPSLIHPGKNRPLLKAKRDRLLKKIFYSGRIDEITLSLAISEPIPDKPYPIPQHTPHLLTRAVNEGWSQQNVKTTIDLSIQKKVNQTVHRYNRLFSSNGIHNMAAIVVDIQTGNTLGYVGNTYSSSKEHGNSVDIISSYRSTGSILKPFLYAALIDEGKILPKTLIPDIPLFIQGFAPKNFSKAYDGAVHADRALARSLNIPAVVMLKDYRYEKFHALLQKLGMSGLNDSPDRYGLSLILGGAEGSLWDLTGMYASMARVLNNHSKRLGSKKYSESDFQPLKYTSSRTSVSSELTATGVLNASSIWEAFNAMLEVYRPVNESSWKIFNASQKIAWKTGTSFGHRDAWSIGVSKRYAVGVWVGNADGEGRPGLTGINNAAPCMFDIFRSLPTSAWFEKPVNEYKKASVCRKSGFINSGNCNTSDSLMIPSSGLISKKCPFHQIIHLDQSEKYRVNSDCQPVHNMTHKSWFILPPIQEYYYKTKNPYKPLPSYRPDCQGNDGQEPTPFEVVYPKPNARIYIPKELDGQQGKTVFEIAHRNASTLVYWHLDNIYIGATKRIHQMGLNPEIGEHKLTLIDENGHIYKLIFEVISE